MSAPYRPDVVVTTRRETIRCRCDGLLRWIYRLEHGRRLVCDQFRCDTCAQIVEYRPKTPQVSTP